MTNSSDSSLPDVNDLLKKTGHNPQEEQYDDDNDKEDNRSKALKNKRELSEIKLRKKYAKKSFNLIQRWIIFIGVVILLKGWKFLNFYIDDKIIYTLLGVSTVTIIAPTNKFSEYIFNIPKKK